MLQYRSTSDLAHAVHGALGDIPSSIDAIVGTENGDGPHFLVTAEQESEVGSFAVTLQRG
jgi:hypothetical protein